MGKFTVEFTIEADSLGHATNRALVALYKGDLDAEDVKVGPKGSSGEKFEKIDAANPRLSYLQSGFPGHTVPRDAANQIGKENLKKFIEKNRKVPEEPHKDALN